MINIISKRELSNSVIYELDDNILRSNIISILKMIYMAKNLIYSNKNGDILIAEYLRFIEK